jgi:hypothetical protein
MRDQEEIMIQGINADFIARAEVEAEIEKGTITKDMIDMIKGVPDSVITNDAMTVHNSQMVNTQQNKRIKWKFPISIRR